MVDPVEAQSLATITSVALITAITAITAITQSPTASSALRDPRR